MPGSNFSNVMAIIPGYISLSRKKLLKNQTNYRLLLQMYIQPLTPYYIFRDWYFFYKVFFFKFFSRLVETRLKLETLNNDLGWFVDSDCLSDVVNVGRTANASKLELRMH